MKKKADTSKEKTSSDATRIKKNSLAWKNRREMVADSIALEVDLENRQLFFQPGVPEKMRFDFGTNNVDKLIKTYLDPKDLKKVNRSLTQAKKGIEKPIPFNFIHPLTSKLFRFEYRYQIIYVTYSSTRLHGELIKVNNLQLKKRKSTIKKLK